MNLDQDKGIDKTQIETSGEVRAFVYQKLDPFEPYLKEESETEVMIEHIAEKNGAEYYEVHLTVGTEEGELSTTGQAEDIYSAVSAASENLMSQISLIHNAVISTRERDLEIHQAYQSQYLH